MSAPFLRLADRREDKPYRFALKRLSEVTLPTGAAYLIKDLIPRTGVVACWGPPKEGKTFVVMDMALHVASGQTYRGRRTKRGPVIYICCEGERGFFTRLAAWRQENPEQADASDFYALATHMQLPTDAKPLIDAIAAQNVTPALVVIDTLNRTLEGSESSDEHMGKYIKSLDAIAAEFSCAVMVVHHCGHDESRMRGHSSLKGAADAVIAIKRAGKGGPITAQVDMMKDGEAGTTIYSQLRTVSVGTDDDGEPITTCVVEPSNSVSISRTKGSHGSALPPAAQIARRARPFYF